MDDNVGASDRSWKPAAQSAALSSVLVAACVYFDTATPLIVATIVPPIYMFRSPQSIEYGVRLYDRFLSSMIGRLDVMSDGGVLNQIIYLPFAVLTFLGAMLIRIVATLVHLKYGLRNWRHNWRETMLEASIFSDIKLVPGTKDSIIVTKLRHLGLPIASIAVFYFSHELLDETLQWETTYLSNGFGYVFACMMILSSFAMLAFFLTPHRFGAAILTFPVLITRATTKAAGLIWLPQAFSYHRAFSAELPLKDRLELMLNDKIDSFAMHLGLFGVFQIAVTVGFLPVIYAFQMDPSLTWWSIFQVIVSIHYLYFRTRVLPFKARLLARHPSKEPAIELSVGQSFLLFRIEAILSIILLVVAFFHSESAKILGEHLLRGISG